MVKGGDANDVLGQVASRDHATRSVANAAMPRKHSPLTLKHCALKEVSLSCERICYGYKKGSRELAKYIAEDGFVEVDGPFVDWPTSLLEDMAMYLYLYRSGFKHLLHLVIQPHLTRFTVKLYGSTYAALALLGDRCSKSLSSLEILYNKNMPTQYYGDFFAKFKNLTRLNLYASMVDDYGFKTIGESCSKLVELNAGATYISDTGIKYLSVGDDLIPAIRNQYRLPRLAVIDLSDTKVTSEGLSLLLACHPMLIRIDHKETFQAFQLIKQQNFRGQKFPFKHLVATDDHLTPANFEYVLDRCPHVESLIITSAGLCNENLYRLMTLQRLTNLHLGNKNCVSFDFYEGVAPVLDSIGGSLKKLVLEDFTEVDVDYIGKKCPNLEHLALSRIMTYAPIGQLNPKYFTKTSSLELWNRIGEDYEYSVCKNTLRQLLFRSPLTYLLLQRIGNLTDDLLEEVLCQNPLLSLRNVIVDYCHNVTGRFFWTLLEQPNNLSVMRCWSCKSVTNRDKDEIHNAVKENNLNLYWECFMYHEYQELLEVGQVEYEEYEIAQQV